MECCRTDLTPLLPAVLAPEDVTELLNRLPSVGHLSSAAASKAGPGGGGGIPSGFVHGGAVVSAGFVSEAAGRLDGVAREAAQEQVRRRTAPPPAAVDSTPAGA